MSPLTASIACLSFALVIQLALDGYFLGESYKTTKLDGNERASLLALLERKPRQARRRATQKGARPLAHFADGKR